MNQEKSDLSSVQEELERLSAFARCCPRPVVELDQDGQITFSNASAEQLKESLNIPSVQNLFPLNFQDIVNECVKTGKERLNVEVEVRERTLSWSFFPVVLCGNEGCQNYHSKECVDQLLESPDKCEGKMYLHCYGSDITEQLALEAQLRQSQKMESIGQLAGGVAHDFNNILTAIMGHSNLLLMREDLDEDITKQVQEIISSAKRAANLTKQLLAFSRRGNISLQPLNLNDSIANIQSMLRRVLGENVRLECQTDSKIPLTMADAGMIDQIILNLSVNARDAMPQGGWLTLSTQLVHRDKSNLQGVAGAPSGRYIRLTVTDTGCGMDKATKERAFEPFFTTKGKGKGTGLGLSTVFGIVKQHHGWIDVESEVGKGSSFHIYFQPSEQKTAEPEPHPLWGSSQVQRVEHGATILIVEDEQTVRTVASNILQSLGYQVLTADSSDQALRVWEQCRDRIDLLLTDMIMPNSLSGKALASKLLKEKQNLKILFTSGYSVELNGDFPGADFVPKPFTVDKLAEAVKKALQ